MRVDVPDAKAEHMLVVDQSEYLDVRRDRCLREIVEQPKDLAASRKMAEGEFGGHPGVRQHIAVSRAPRRARAAVGRSHRAAELDAVSVESELRALTAAPIQRHPVTELMAGAWARRHQLRLVDALYVELAVSLGVPLVTTDRRLRAAPAADVVTA